MNYAQMVLFLLYFLSVLTVGSFIYAILFNREDTVVNRILCLGEILLLGSIFLVGEFLLLSLLGFYSAFYLSVVVFLNYLFILNKNTRKILFVIFNNKLSFDPPAVIFIAVIIILIFRNCYFLVDIDSISTYLFTQKLWLSAGSSLIGSISNDMRVFVPQFDIVPTALGISIFGQETLFAQLINLFWRLIVIFLVYGYTYSRLNGYCALAAVMLVVFDSHFFYSGVNQWVLINGALIALLFASAYNFLESRRQNSLFRFLLALIFLSQLMANKYQMIYVLFFMLFVGVVIQYNPLGKFKKLFSNKKYLLAVVMSISIMLLWYIKNMLVTGTPVFPVFADKINGFNWTAERIEAYRRVFGGISLQQFIKYMSYFFIWPGIKAAKFAGVIIAFLPLTIMLFLNRKKFDNNVIFEICFWISMYILIIMGICLVCHQDPRYYRYPIGIASFLTVFFFYSTGRLLIGEKNKIFLNITIVLVVLTGCKVVVQEGGYFNFPTFKENIAILSNRIHIDYAINKHYRQVPVILKGLENNKDKISAVAWDGGEGVNFPSFFLPIKPMVSLWLTTIVKWDSYGCKESVIADLKEQNIDWIMRVEDGELRFLSISEYAQEAVKYQRYPGNIFYNYGFPSELSIVR